MASADIAFWVNGLHRRIQRETERALSYPKRDGFVRPPCFSKTVWRIGPVNPLASGKDQYLTRPFRETERKFWSHLDKNGLNLPFYVIKRTDLTQCDLNNKDPFSCRWMQLCRLQVQFSSVHDGIYALGKVHIRSTGLRSFSEKCPQR